MNTAPRLSPREHWHLRATALAQLDCFLCQLLPSHDLPIAQLQPEKFQTLARQLAQIVESACKDATNQVAARDIERWMATEIWNFVKTLNPALPAFTTF